MSYNLTCILVIIKKTRNDNKDMEQKEPLYTVDRNIR